MLQADVDQGVFQETKVTKVIYMQYSSGYQVVASESPIAHSNGITMLFCVAEHFSVEALHLHNINIVSF